jgi:hypothetical protein
VDPEEHGRGSLFEGSRIETQTIEEERSGPEARRVPQPLQVTPVIGP